MPLPKLAITEQDQHARPLLFIIGSMILSSGIACVLALTVPTFKAMLFPAAFLILASVALLGLLRWGYIQLTALGFIAAIFVMRLATNFVPELALVPGVSTAFVVVDAGSILLAALLIGWWCTFPVAVLFGGSLAITEQFSTMKTEAGPVSAISMLMFCFIVSLFARSLQIALRQARAQQHAAQAAAQQATDLNHQLEATLRDTHTLLDQERLLRDTIAQLSVPIQQIGDHVLFVPLIGHIDDQRGEQIATTMLQHVHAARAREIIIDVQAISVIDTNVAALLNRLIQAIQLLGVDVAITGISSSMAITVTQLGITFNGVAIYPTVNAALKAIIQRRTFTAPAMARA